MNFGVFLEDVYNEEKFKVWATDVEQIIASVWNNETFGDLIETKKETKKKGITDIYKDLEKAEPFAREVYKFLKKQPELKRNVGEAKFVGSKAKDVKPVDWWQGRNVAKTDILIESARKKVRISVKHTSTNMVVSSGSHGKEIKSVLEATKQYGYVQDDLKEVEKIVNNTIFEMEQVLQADVGKRYPYGVKELRKQAKVDPEIAEAYEKHEELHEKIRDFFRNNYNIRKAFVEEGLTGKVKFGNDSIARAEFLLSTDNNGEFEFSKITEPYVEKVMNYVHPTISIRGTNLATKDNPSFKIFSNLLFEFKKGKKFIEENMNEDIYDENFLIDLINKTITKLKEIGNKIITFLRTSFERFLEFFGLEFVVSGENLGFLFE